MNKKYICPSPGNGLGISNKLHCWAFAHSLAQQKNMEVAIDWEDGMSLLDLPQTVRFSSICHLKWTDFDTRRIRSLNDVPSNVNLKLKCGFMFNRNLFNFLFKPLFSNIKLKHPIISDITTLTKNPNLIGVHIRRSDFRRPTGTDVDFNTINSRISFKWYEKVMGDLCKINSKSCFYISTENLNITSRLANQFNIINRNNFYVDQNMTRNQQSLLKDLIDLFVLSLSPTFIETPTSSFSHLAASMSKNRTITSNSYSNWFFHMKSY